MRDFKRGDSLKKSLTAERLNELKNKPVLKVEGDGRFLLAQRNGQEVVIRPSELLLEAIRRAGTGAAGGGPEVTPRNVFSGYATDGAGGATFMVMVIDTRHVPPLPTTRIYPHIYIRDEDGLLMQDWKLSVGVTAGLLPGECCTVTQADVTQADSAYYEVRIGEGDKRDCPVQTGGVNGNVLTLGTPTEPSITTLVDEYIGGRIYPDADKTTSLEITDNSAEGGGPATFTVTVDSSIDFANYTSAGKTARIVPHGSGDDISVLGAALGSSGAEMFNVGLSG